MTRVPFTYAVLVITAITHQTLLTLIFSVNLATPLLGLAFSVILLTMFPILFIFLYSVHCKANNSFVLN